MCSCVKWKGNVDAHQKKRRKKNAATGIWIFRLFSTEKHNVYNIYVAINVPSFFKLNCMCIYFSHRTNTFVSVSVSSPYLHFLLSIKFYFMKNKHHRKGEVRWAQKHVDVLTVFCFMFWRHFYSGFRPNECFIVCNSFLKIIPVDHCSLYEKCYEYMFLFLIKCDSSVLYMCCAPAFFFLHSD